MQTRDFEFDLPPERIAQEPLPRGRSRLLVLDAEPSGRHRNIADLPTLLRPGDLLVVNDTRVIPARLFARRPTGGRVEILLVERQEERRWWALLKPGRRLAPGARLHLEDPSGAPLGVEVLAKRDNGRFDLRFDRPVSQHLPSIGHMPLPPYIRRPDRPADHERYQTVFAREDGAIAAPTAGLHFDDALLEALERAGIRRATITLHVGIGTFKPVTAEVAEEHTMESERFRIPPETVAEIRRCRERGGRVVAVGTTVVRCLEGSCQAHGGELVAGTGATELFIRPGFRFRTVDLLLTNFHLPRSTLLMLVCALAGRERVLAAYREAVETGYRFYSYGDAMLLEHHREAASSSLAKDTDPASLQL